MKKQKPSVLIATPMYGGVCHTNYLISLLDNIQDLHSHNYVVNLVLTENESLITRGRNLLTKQFLDSEFSHIMFIDSDIGFPGDAIRRLLEHDLDFTCAVYPKKGINWAKVKEYAAIVDNPSHLEEYSTDIVMNSVSNYFYDEKGLLEVKHAGTGFMLLSRNVFEKMQPHVKKYYVSFEDLAESGWIYEFWNTHITSQGHFLSEDWAFSDFWLKLGGKIFADTTIQLTHRGNYLFKGTPITF